MGWRTLKLPYWLRNRTFSSFPAKIIDSPNELAQYILLRILRDHKFDIQFDTSLLVDASRKNLARLLAGKVQFGQTAAGIHGFLTDRDDTAALLLISDYLNFARNKLEDDLIIAIPSKDILSFVPASSPKMIEELKIEVNEIHQNSDKPLSMMLFKYNGEALSEFAS